ncbi:hypothetical protein [Moorena producens]|uniref:hypothetical protein n=1 Tax=Moorena producens TaxID=1155739 RepID=UPI003C79626D
MTNVEKRNMERVKHWEWAWNNDAMRMVDECYAEDCKVYDMLGGGDRERRVGKML